MHNPGTRRVRRVYLQAKGASLLRRGTLLLEDALHVATLPAAAGRLLLIRSLDVGSIRSGASSSSLALQIEARLRRLPAVHALDAAAASRPIVYFHDDAEPARYLAARLVLQQDVSAWFWPLAVPGFRHDMPRPEAVRAVLFAALQSPAGPLAAVALCQELLEQGGIDSLLSTFHLEDGPALLRACGLSLPAARPVAPLRAELLTQVAARWERPLSKWVATWGVNDARTLWLAAVALLAQKPARLGSSRLSEQAQRLLQTCLCPTGAGRDGLRQTQTPAGSPEATPIPAPYALAVPTSARSAAAASPPGGSESLLGGSDSPPRGSDSPRPRLGPVRPQTRRPLSSASQSVSPHSAAIDPARPQRTAQESPPPEAFTADTDSPPPITPAPDRRPPPAAREGAQASERSLTDLSELLPPTEYAGLFFLLPVLSRLGIAEALKRVPEWAELDLARRILRHAASYLGAPDADAAVLSIGAAEDEARELEPLLAAWLTELRRFCVRVPRLSLRRLVLRKGQVQNTRTHLDVHLDHRQTDVRVRRAGLDIDPGWIPWFGQVVHFHYSSGAHDAD